MIISLGIILCLMICIGVWWLSFQLTICLIHSIIWFDLGTYMIISLVVSLEWSIVYSIISLAVSLSAMLVISITSILSLLSWPLVWSMTTCLVI